MSKKDLNPESVINELKGQSVFFKPTPEEPQSPTQSPEEAAPPQSEPVQTERKSVRKSERTEIRTGKLPVKRLSRRYSFEFYDDQITTLKRLKHEAEMEGQRVTLSDMARDAIDEYLKGK
jgi:hypothetical protein